MESQQPVEGIDVSFESQDQTMVDANNEEANNQPEPAQMLLMKPPPQAHEHKRKREERTEAATSKEKEEEADKRCKTSGEETAASETNTTITTTKDAPAKNDDTDVKNKPKNGIATSPATIKRIDDQRRWRVHQMTEDYVDLASHMMLFPTTHLGPYGYNNNNQGNNGKTNSGAGYPLELISSLGFLKSPLRRPTIIETWSPYEISLFEAGMGHVGKDFYQIHKIIQTKSTKEVIDFYYVWKKTSHYKVWKKEYVVPGEIVSEDEYGSTPIKKPAAR